MQKCHNSGKLTPDYPGGPPVIVAEGDPLRISPLKKLLNDPKNTAYNEKTVSSHGLQEQVLRQTSAHCQLYEDSTKKKFSKRARNAVTEAIVCASCRKRGKTNVMARQASSKVMHAMGEVAGRKVCSHCAKELPIAKFHNADGQVCALCNNRTTMHLKLQRGKKVVYARRWFCVAENESESHQRLTNDQEPEHACSSCRNRNRENMSAWKEDLKAIRAVLKADYGHREGLQGAHVLPIDEFDTVEGVMRSRCKSCYYKNNKDAKKNIEAGKMLAFPGPPRCSHGPCDAQAL
ncbi:hypothetical protein BC940DRAFT_347310 [Gongronella butleri]|nr:hypothetical protein BC940DRAFT_347310 [Gongronella butleri]